jgi:hypothetical protein
MRPDPSIKRAHVRGLAPYRTFHRGLGTAVAHLVPEPSRDSLEALASGAAFVWCSAVAIIALHRAAASWPDA